MKSCYFKGEGTCFHTVYPPYIKLLVQIFTGLTNQLNWLAYLHIVFDWVPQIAYSRCKHLHA